MSPLAKTEAFNHAMLPWRYVGDFDRYIFFDNKLQRRFENRDKAQALLNYVEDGTHADRFEAIGGSITIESAPQSMEEWQADSPLRAKISVLFPKKAMRTVECNGACMDVDGEAVNCHETCICKDLDGTQSTCELTTTGADTCCLNLDGETVEYSLEFIAEPCPEMCDWVIGSPHPGQYCQQLSN